MITHKNDTGKDILTWAKDIDEDTMDQALNVAALPFIHNRVCIMADGHKGYGMPIGGVIGATDCVSPYMVGSDIGCGVAVCPTSYKADAITSEQIKEVCDLIDEFVPTGQGIVHKDAQVWSGFKCLDTDPHIKEWLSPTKRAWVERSLGTLGAGNHFMSLEKGDEGRLYLMVHSGSRNLGYMICAYYHAQAFAMNQKWHSILPDKFLAYLPIDSYLGGSYIKYMNFALDFAKESRRLMIDAMKHAVVKILGTDEGFVFDETLDVHHNYASLENHGGKNLWVHRKGAIRAYEGEVGVIPGSQGTPSYIVRGLGNTASFKSCSHGAGRVHGRVEACRKLDVADETEKMEGIYFKGWGTKDIKIEDEKKPVTNLEEAPGSYKDIEEVMDNQADLVEKVMRLQPLGVIKG